MSGEKAASLVAVTTAAAIGSARPPVNVARAWHPRCKVGLATDGPPPPSSRDGNFPSGRRPMRLIVGISLMLLGVGSLSCRLEGTSEFVRPSEPQMTWVRTVNGWERPAAWRASQASVPQLHPVVVAAGQGLASILALAVFRREEEKRP